MVAGVLPIELPIPLLHRLARAMGDLTIPSVHEATHNRQQDFIRDRGPLLEGWMRGKGRLDRWIHGEGGDLWLSNIATVAMMAVGAVITAVTMATLVAMLTVVAMATLVAMLTVGTMATLVATMTVGTMATLVASVTLLATITVLAVVTVIGALGDGTRP